VLTSPTGLEVDESSDDSSENIILRVDGTTAGGPTLNIETNQKAGGGTWKMMVQENGAHLRIRLSIPPRKERILVMEGPVIRMGAPMDVPVASRAFGIPHLEARAKEADKDIPEQLICSGDVYIEEAITKERAFVGEFSLMKLARKNDQYTITIPNAVRIQD
jgi:hypothetical protein